MKKRATFLIICILLVQLTSFGQNLENNVSTDRNSKTEVVLERTILFVNDSDTEELIFEIKQKTLRLDLLIRSSVKKGKVTIEVYDPKGTRQGDFTLGSLLNSKKEELVNGDILKSLVEPQSGKWKVKIITEGATGSININTAIAE